MFGSGFRHGSGLHMHKEMVQTITVRDTNNDYGLISIVEAYPIPEWYFPPA